MSDRPFVRRYARVERERRFLLEGLPDAVDSREFVRLRDRFVAGSSLRIRRVESPDGVELVTKLGQKRVDPDAPSDPRRRLLTTIYLPPGEADSLSALTGPTSVKRRYTHHEQGRTWAIDVWEEPRGHADLVLAEIECESDAELEAMRPPVRTVREVTYEPGFSAFELASS